MRLNHVVIFLLVLFTLGCSENNTEPKLVSHPPSNEDQDPFPTNIVAPVSAKFQNSDHFLDIFSISKFVKLKDIDGSFIQYLEDVLWVDNHWVVLDSMGKQVLLFDESGKFVRKIGAQGSGPGEYQQPFSIFETSSNGIAVSSRERLTIFEIDGTVRETLNGVKDTDGLLISGSFAWPKPNVIMMFDINVRDTDSNAWNHVILQRKDGESFEVLTKFGKRFSGLKNRTGTFPEWFWRAFAIIDKNIWMGSPYHSNIEVFNMDGSLIQKMAMGHPKGLQYEDFRGVNFSSKVEISKKIYHKFRNLKITSLADKLVLTSYDSFSPIQGRLFNLYAADGKLIKKGIAHHPLRKLWVSGANNYSIYGVARADFDDKALLNRFFHKEEVDALMKAGWRLNSTSQNYVWIASLKPWARDALGLVNEVPSD